MYHTVAIGPMRGAPHVDTGESELAEVCPECDEDDTYVATKVVEDPRGPAICDETFVSIGVDAVKVHLEFLEGTEDTSDSIDSCRSTVDH